MSVWTEWKYCLGVETEHTGAHSLELAGELVSKYSLDYNVGSVHHVNGCVRLSLISFSFLCGCACAWVWVYVDRMEMRLCMETEHTGAHSSELAGELVSKYSLEYIVGSVHHVNGYVCAPLARSFSVCV